MTRGRAAWIAAGLVLLFALGYVVRLRRRPKPALPLTDRPPVPVTATPVEGRTSAGAVIDQPTPIEEEPPVRTEVAEVVEDDELPLATWARVAIVLVGVLVFSAIGLLAVKQI